MTTLSQQEQAELDLPFDGEDNDDDDDNDEVMDVPSVENLDPVPGFTGKLVKRVCAQGFIFHTLEAEREMVLLWFETKIVNARKDVKKLINGLKFDTVYQFKDVHDFTPWINNGKLAQTRLGTSAKTTDSGFISDQDRAVLIDDLDLYDRFCLSAKVQRVMAWTRGCTFTPKYSLRKKYAHITVTGKTQPPL